MSGHSHWAGIKRKKEAVDQKRGQLFSKLLSAIAIAARDDSNLQFNPRLRAAVEKARENKVPQENIERAIRRASEDRDLEELLIEAYGPEGVAILIEAVTDNKNRTLAEIKKILTDNGAKFAEAGSVRWVFSQATAGENRWQAKFKQEISENAKIRLAELAEALKERGDTQEVYTNT